MRTALLFVVAAAVAGAQQPTNPNHQNPPPTGVEDTTSTGRRAEPTPEMRRGTEKVVTYDQKKTKSPKKRKPGRKTEAKGKSD
jgi:hypothetical protein